MALRSWTSRYLSGPTGIPVRFEVTERCRRVGTNLRVTNEQANLGRLFSVTGSTYTLKHRCLISLPR